MTDPRPVLQALWIATNALRTMRNAGPELLDPLTVEELEQVRTHLAAGAYSCQEGARLMERTIAARAARKDETT